MESLTICPNGFDPSTQFMKMESCWKYMPDLLDQAAADAECLKYNGATLVMISSCETTHALQQYLRDKGVSRIWTGLTCNQTGVPTSCYWSDGRPSTSVLQADPGANDFAPGSPNVTVGECISYEESSRHWISTNCGVSMTFVCEVPPTSNDNCTYNYNHNCYFPSNNSLTFGDAQKSCAQNCGNLVSIHSELENRYVASLFSEPGTIKIGGVAPSKSTIIRSDYSNTVFNNLHTLNNGNCLFMDVNSDDSTDGLWYTDNCSRASWERGVSRIWIGLTCNETAVKTSCYWSDGRSTSSIQADPGYNEFAPGSPNVTVGKCISYEESSRHWISTNCGVNMTFVCEVPPTSNDSCTHNYNHNCYFPNNNILTFGEAQKSCAQNCGNLVSIHSELENRYIASLFSEPGTIKIGGVAPSKNTIIWSDYTNTVFNNLHTFNNGNCLFMDVNTDDSTDGLWYTDNCSRASWYVCKRPNNSKCSL
ncbi:hypothetical protein GCK72_021673 [Caenorhabditis remanei]|uniref:C-type lectin domain-containing protein n=1 Tax=Caenorhabditis remanei TaxID=31234 RepID=A0A6A5GK64_CAERE|nr:hypothetical protein GCK72_021673 [Caenorhabditis remanei]KAF1755104.1 hypothetical protein GCK72_021673 [Caenorhabditis remanei]